MKNLKTTTTHYYYNIHSLTNSNLKLLLNSESNLKSYIQYLLDFYSSHNIKKLDLQTSYNLTCTLFNFTNSEQLLYIKLISLLTYLKFNNITNLTQSQYSLLINQLKIKSTSTVEIFDTITDFGELISTEIFTLEN